MKKIGVITDHNPCNYGATLQAYATVKILNNMGFETKIINYKPNIMKKFGELKDTIHNIEGNHIKKIVVGSIKNISYKQMKKKFTDYSSKILSLTKEYKSYDDLCNNIPNVDIFCTGSDQVWNNYYTKSFEKAYFLEFVSKDIPCFSFSSSFGKAKFNKKENEKLKHLLSKYEFISVREKDGINILNNIGYKRAKQLLDPTLMVDYNEWNKFIINNKIEQKYILVYQLHGDSLAYKMARKFSKDTGYTIIKINTMYHQFRNKCKNVMLPSIEEFITYFNNAEYVFTDSFHGVVFSLIFKKKIGITLPNNFSNRITSLLDIINEKRYIISDYDKWKENINKIDTEKIYSLLQKEKQKKLLVLEKYLETKR